MAVIDRKFQIKAVNPTNGNTYTEKDSLLLCAKDAAVPAALEAYRGKCIELGANEEHVHSVALLTSRVVEFQRSMGGGRVPDTIGAEIARCLTGDGVQERPGCVWSRHFPGSEMFSTSCGHDFRVDDGMPSEDGMKFCTFCGEPLIERSPLTDEEWQELAEKGEQERADLFERTLQEDEHPEDYDGPCMCRECRSYGE